MNLPFSTEVKGNLLISSSSDPTTVGTGSLVVYDGLYVNSIYPYTDTHTSFLNTQQSTSSNTGSVVILGGAGISKNLFVAGITTSESGIRIPLTNSIEFGFGITKELNAGKISYSLFSEGLDIVGAGTSSGSRSVTLWDNLNIINNLNSPGIITFTNTTDSTNLSTGSIIVSGGMGVGKTLSISSKLRIFSDTSNNIGIVYSGMNSYDMILPTTRPQTNVALSYMTSDTNVNTSWSPVVLKNIYNGVNIINNVTVYISTSTTTSGVATFTLRDSGNNNIFSTIISAYATTIRDTTTAIQVPVASIRTISNPTITVNVIVGVSQGILIGGTVNTFAFAPNGTVVYLVCIGF